MPKTRSQQTSNNQNHHAELLKQLWEAAVNLRGSIDTPDYKRY
ncbi:unnamed protein product, partial [marine sediment metagenome]